MRYPAVIRFTRVLVVLGASALCVGAAHAQTPPSTRGGAGLANPASQNCASKGGNLTLEKNGKGDQFGVCAFADNLQCEEWAMMRGDCRNGGIKVTGFVTPAARYCAITGGTYKVISGSNTANEQGTCSFKGGKTCKANAYFDGTCTRDSRPPAPTPAQPTVQSAAVAHSIHAAFTCDADKTIDAVFTNGPPSNVKLALSDGRKMVLPQAMSGSGARYANKGETLVFWNKGDTAFIEESGKTTYSGCATKP